MKSGVGEGKGIEEEWEAIEKKVKEAIKGTEKELSNRVAEKVR